MQGCPGVRTLCFATTLVGLQTGLQLVLRLLVPYGSNFHECSTLAVPNPINKPVSKIRVVLGSKDSATGNEKPRVGY